MNKFHAIKQLKLNGDSIISIAKEDGILATTDFSAKYIKSKKFSRFAMQKQCILVFSWTDDEFRNIPVSSIIKIEPLSQILKNKNPEVLRNG